MLMVMNLILKKNKKNSSLFITIGITLFQMNIEMERRSVLLKIQLKKQNIGSKLMHAKLLNKNQTKVINHQDEKTAIENTDKNNRAIEEPKLTDTQSTRKINQTLLKCD